MQTIKYVTLNFKRFTVANINTYNYMRDLPFISWIFNGLQIKNTIELSVTLKTSIDLIYFLQKQF